METEKTINPMEFDISDVLKFSKNNLINAAFISTGCKLNQFESDQFEEILKFFNPNIKLNIVNYCNKENSIPCTDKNNLDLFFINTCSVTEKANTETNRIIRKIKKRHPDSMLIITGCSVQLDFSVYSNMKNIRLINNSVKTALLEYASKSIPNIYLNQKRIRPYLKIQEGCSLRCAFCIIPDARPEKWSMKTDDVIEALRKFDLNGFKEVVFTGVNIGSYNGFANNGNSGFKNLLKLINNSDFNLKIRISSIDPFYFDDDLIEILADLIKAKKIQDHFHIPLQSGSNRILKLMNRHYDFNFYNKIVEKLVSKIEGVSIGTDIISGFPTESETDFNETVVNLTNLPLSYIHAFSYSDRKGTVSSDMKPKVSEKRIKERTNIIRKISADKKNAFTKKFVGKPLYFLTLPGGMALSANYIKAKIMDNDSNLNMKTVNNGISYFIPGTDFIGKIIDFSGEYPTVAFENEVNKTASN